MDTKYFRKLERNVSSLGMGTWRMGGGFMERDESLDETWITALRRGLELGLTLIDTAEVYGAGHAEELVGEAIKGFPREELFIVSKVWPAHAERGELIKAAEASCRRLGTYIDLYLLHWPTSSKLLRGIMRDLEKVVEMGIVRNIGVSNFDIDQIEEARSYLSKCDLAAVQNRFSLAYRRWERDVIPYAEREGMMFMAYTPLEKGNLARSDPLAEIGLRYGKTSAQVALNWLMCIEPVVPIPKAASVEHVEENAGAMGWRLREDDWKTVSRLFRSDSE